MIEEDTRFLTGGREVVDPVVSDLLKEFEKKNSFVEGEIVDIATIDPSDPYQNFSVNPKRITNPSKKRIKRLISVDEYQNSIVIAVELDSSDVILDVFTYDSSPQNDYTAVESLCMKLGVDIATIHHLIGETVELTRQNGHWEICELRDDPREGVSVTPWNFFTPVLIAGILTPLGVVVGWQTDLSIILTTLSGAVATVMAYLFLLYITLAAKRDQPLPGVLGRLVSPDNTGTVGEVDPEDDIVDIQHGEFERLHTLVDHDDTENNRDVLHNMAIDVTIPPSGGKTIPVPLTTTGWDGTVAKGVVYSLSDSVETLDRAQGELIPLRSNEGQIEIDETQISVKPARRLTLSERVADRYVCGINRVFNTPRKEDLYSIDRTE